MEKMDRNTEKQNRINEIKEILDKDFIGLNIGKFAYCENQRDYVLAHYFNNSIEACIQVTKNKSHFHKEHRKLIIFDSYCRELLSLEGLNI